MELASLTSYVPVALGSIALGVIANRADKSIDVVRNLFSKRKSNNARKLEEEANKQAQFLLNSRFSVHFFISESALGIVTAVIGAALSTSSAVVIFLTSKTIVNETYPIVVYLGSNILEYVGIYFIFKGMSRLNRLWRVYLKFVDVELEELRQARVSLLNKVDASNVNAN